MPPDIGSLKELSVGGALLIALWLVLKFRPWEKRNGNGNGDYDKRIAAYLVKIAEYTEELGEIRSDIKELRAMFFGMDGQGGLFKEFERLRTGQDRMEADHQNMQLRISNLERRRRPE